ncbi:MULTISPECIES: helix-turn-helix transcriptional regulator [unclassified Virgibacillus]|uniref:helix-turn-helix domain-containing protein n=1 Tax=unclassified Virgibacillus TaxID=2620237 RepID=UPI0024DEF4B1|nr:helix-turn-helix transcriptional regulator [Virgibacillus sp. LDC-1]
MSSEKLAYHIKYLREQHHWSQQELADKLHISRSVVTKWETNAVTPDVSKLMKLCDLFDVTLDHLVGRHSFRDDLLKDFKRIYSSESKAFDEEVVELVEYLMQHPQFRNEIYRLQGLSFKKQQAVHDLFGKLIDQFERL